MAKKLTLSQIDKVLLSKGFVRLESDSTYKNTQVPILLKCINGGHVIQKAVNWVRQTGCGECSNRRLHTQEEAEQIAREYGWELISLYYGNKTDVVVECKLKHTLVKDWSHITDGRGCHICSGMTRWANETIDKWLEENEPNYKRLSDYIDINKKMEFACPVCTSLFEATWHKFKNGKTRCPKCAIDKIRGNKHYRWNSALTDEDRELARIYPEYLTWRKDVFKRDNYKCQSCGSTGKLNAHHLYGYAEHFELRTELDNGITLCPECHKSFHHDFGIKNNTPQQFIKWLSIHFPHRVEPLSHMYSL